MTRIAGITAAAALLAGVAATGVAVAQGGPMGGSMMGSGRGGLDFAAIDTDGNGTLSRDELIARATERLSAADTNGDGALDRNELIIAMPGRHGGLGNIFAADPAEAMADRLLAMMGATEAGRIEIATLADQRVNFLLAFVDTNRDSAISRAEADAMRAHRRAWMERHEHDQRHRMERHGPEGRAPGGDGTPRPRG